jgi:hypothetical protein
MNIDPGCSSMNMLIKLELDGLAYKLWIKSKHKLSFSDRFGSRIGRGLVWILNIHVLIAHDSKLPLNAMSLKTIPTTAQTQIKV